jgi:adenine-specific DNA-methyltransferase
VPSKVKSPERRADLKQSLAAKPRQAPPDVERKMWSLLRAKRLGNLRFRRQQPIGPYVVNFYCSAAKLIVELDGSQHGESDSVQYDNARTAWLSERGYRVLRIWNGELLTDPNGVLEFIYRAATEEHVPLPARGL